MGSRILVYQIVKGHLGFSWLASALGHTMDEQSLVAANPSHGGFTSFLRKCLFSVMSVGPIPAHIAFIMDGNRRYAKRRNLPVGEGHKAGYWSLMSLLRYCWEMGVKYVTVYAFSIDNFKRPPDEVQILMDLLQEKIEGLLDKRNYLNQAGVRVCFIGNLKLLSEPVRVAAENAMKATANNSNATLLICVAYTSTDEIVHAVEESCKEKMNEIQVPNGRKVSNGVIHGVKEGGKVNGVTETDVHKSCNNNFDGELGTGAVSNGKIERVEKVKKENGTVRHVVASNCLVEEVEESGEQQQKIPRVKLVDVEKHMYMAVAPDPDILIRTSGETRLSNFLLWQSSNCPLYSPAALWPDLGLWQLVWAVLNFQRNHYYLEKKKKQA
ncbi:putative rubber cis-polyprenylcistransferase [Rosa chinensis]|uniref:Alkyl transferase n=2 Tax=Rosa chinensis TaxID=74649 RepID=A0A2P6RLA4_ROSCH|nr:dehydrodolichyl diphosphate synthase CPT3 isoform X2 [Rosa chinensis]PRQ47222.1 putative rubber cis-polyprenylcistransferase [Rosa chinensis]